jgi:hypothetical protein
VQAVDMAALPSTRRTGKLVDKHILNTLVQATTSAEGKGSRPGNKQLMKNAGVKWSQVHVHLENLINAKMIERTSVGDGAWNASVYRILYNHPGFPDHSENMREWFCIGGPDDSGPNHSVTPNHPVTKENSSKPSGYEGANHPVMDTQPSGYEAENRRNHPVTMPDDNHHPPTKIPTPIPTNETEKAGGGRLFSETLRKWQATLPSPMNTEAMGRHEPAIAEWAKEIKSVRLAKAYVSAWVDRREIRGLRDLWGFFLKEYMLHEKEARSMTPEGQANEEAAVEAAVEQAKRLHPELYASVKTEEEQDAEREADIKRWREAK